MAATTVGLKIKQTAGRRAYRVKASEVIYAGAMVGIDSSGRAVSPTATTGLMIVGVAAVNARRQGTANAKGDQVWDATGLSDGDFMVEVIEGRFSFQNSSAGDAILATSRRKVIYAQDNQTLALTSNSGARSPAGISDGLDDEGLPVVALSLEIAKMIATLAGVANSYTQTYATANRTVAAATAVDPSAATATSLTNAFGTANGTLEDTSGTSSAIANNFQECTDRINKLITDVASIRTQVSALIVDDLDNRQSINAIIDDLQALGLVG